MIEIALNILALLFIGIGAFIAARAVVISEKQLICLATRPRRAAENCVTL
jgi:hypothetical protein